jgi:hypothetical protein
MQPMTFKDINDRQWRVEWDGLLLDDVRTETGIDLADLSAGGLATIDQDAPKLVKVLSVLLREEISAAKMTDRQFSKAIRGKALPAALAAVLGAAADFFPESVWLEVQQRFESQREFRTNWTKIKPLLAKLNEPEMENLRPTIFQALTEMMGGGSLEHFQALASATGQVPTQSPPATDSPVNSESAQAV